MDLTFRPIEYRDVHQCLSLVRGRRLYPDDVLGDLPAAWHRLLQDEAAISTVIEDLERSDAARIVGFGMSVFITDAFMREARVGAEPYLSARLIRADTPGASPILRPAAIAKANARNGLGLVLLHCGVASEVVHEDELRRVLYTILEGFLWEHRGYRVNEVLQELWDEIPPHYAQPGWGRIRSNYAMFYAQRGLSLPQPGQGPVLVGLTRDEVLAEPGSTMLAPLFSYLRPRFGFRRGEQQLLGRALLGQTDPELARALHIALPTVKSRWRAIYNRLVACAPELLPDSTNAGDTRGKEKRRRVLEYLRRHPEELRPLDTAGLAAPETPAMDGDDGRRKRPRID